jgi:hypothetical protein
LALADFTQVPSGKEFELSTIDVYHYARAEDLDAISEEGLKTGSPKLAIESELRNGAVFCWSSPDFDVMGYNENPQYICLRARVEVGRCKVAPFELAQAAYVNHIGRGQPKNPDVAARLVSMYEKLAVPYDQFERGQFRAPEILVEGEVSADDIAVVKAQELGRSGEENRRVYAVRWAEHLIRVLSIQKTLMKLPELTVAATNRGVVVRVARHDDATAYLETYMIADTGDFYTVEKED